MGFPSSDMEGLYRNPIGEVYRFFELRHKDNYKLYNLCAERDYDHAKFHGRVSRYPFEDHNAPPIDLIVKCCADIHAWLGEDENHVVGINCKAGKGRTGLIICCYLMHSKVVLDSDEAMLYYGSRRTKDGKGVTIASQQRYVRYYNQVLNLGGTPPEPRLLMLKSLRFHTIPDFSGDPYIIIISQNQEVHKSKPSSVAKKAATHDIEVGYPVHGDVKIQFCVKKGRSHQNTCHFWFSTAFVPTDTNSIELQKKEIDVANKDKKNAHFKADFRIEAFFDVIEVATPSSANKGTKKGKKASTEIELAAPVASPSTTKETPKNGRKSKHSSETPEGSKSSTVSTEISPSISPAPAPTEEAKPIDETVAAPAEPVENNHVAAATAETSSSSAPLEPTEPVPVVPSPTPKPKKGVAIAEDADAKTEKKDGEFSQRRKRAQSFYDTSSSDEGLSSSEIDEKHMDAYFASEVDEDDEVAGPLTPGTPISGRKAPASPRAASSTPPTSAPTSPKPNGDANGHAAEEKKDDKNSKKDKKELKKQEKKDKKAEKAEKSSTPTSPKDKKASKKKLA